MFDPLKKNSNRERTHIVIIITIVILLTSIPYLYGHLNKVEGYFYNGIHSLSHGDFSVYYSYINQIRDGQILIYNNFALEESQRGIFNIFWFISGLFARITNLSASNTLFIIKILLIPPAILLFYTFIGVFFKKINDKITALWILSFSSGIGTFAIPFLISHIETKPFDWPIDYWVPESNTFLTLYHIPHSIASLMLMISIYFLIIKAIHTGSTKKALTAGICGLVLFNFHPYHVITINMIISIYLLKELIIRPKQWILYVKIFLAWFIPSTLSVIYHYILIVTDFTIGVRAGQNITTTPPFIYIILGYGFLFLFAVIGLYYYFRNKKNIETETELFDFVVIWFIVNTIMLYFPITFQRRFLTGYHIPIVLLTVYSFNFLKEYFYIRKLKGNNYLLITLTVIFLGLSSLTNVIRDIIFVKNANINFYTPIELKETMKWLQQRNDKFTTLTYDEFQDNEPFSPSVWIPAYINRKTYISHDHETLFYYDKKNLLKKLMEDNNETRWNDFYKNFNIGYVLVKNNGSGSYYNVTSLEEVYRNKRYLIYKTDLIQDEATQ